MMFESDIHILQTSSITYRLEYDNPTSIETLVIDENNQHLIDYVITCDIQSSFYNYYSMKDKVYDLRRLLISLARLRSRVFSRRKLLMSNKSKHCDLCVSVGYAELYPYNPPVGGTPFP
jgi:hypothetical protein